MKRHEKRYHGRPSSWRRNEPSPAWFGPSMGGTRGDPRMPGGMRPSAAIERIIRVDHAGEYGAVRIYDGQLAVLEKSPRAAPAAAIIHRMAEQERQHLTAFERLLRERRARPTLLTPLWHGAGFALGVATALISERAAMACTAAVEEVIDTHYARQSAQLGRDEAELRRTLDEFRADENEHREAALTAGAADSLVHRPLTAVVKVGCRAAIWLSERF